MMIHSQDYEKLGQFYLGREYNAENKSLLDELILYDSKDLVTHGVVLGMTGSGKTGLCLALLEEAAMDQIPSIVIDPKGDIANLLLSFPDLDASSFRPWVNPDDAAKKSISIDEHAANTASMWKKGLADWGQEPERIASFREKTDIVIYTPGSNAGIPVSILSSLATPPFEVMDDGELLGERIESTVSSLLSLVGVNDDAIQSPEAVLCAAIFKHAWQKNEDLTLESIIRHIQKPSFDKIGVIDLASFMPEKNRQALALKLNNLLASPSFASWLQGPPLDIGSMLYQSSGKPRIAIFSIAHLGDSERMFFVSLLLNQLLGWMRGQSGTTSLRALMYMDEIFGFLPPTANPPSKRPMMTLLKQGRAFGLGCLLATQNPVDLDYKALSNIGTWFLGRLQTERDKLRVLDGLEGAAGSQNAKFDRADIERLLSGLGNRVFLMNNVHEDHPVLFHVRWVMSYLTGPLTRSQIKLLMDPRRDEFISKSNKSNTPSENNPMAMPGVRRDHTGQARPVVGAGVVERFVPISEITDNTRYEPCLLREGQVIYRVAKAGLDAKRSLRLVNPMTATTVDWQTQVPPPVDHDALLTEPSPGIAFAELPGFAMNAANYKQVQKDFVDWIYQNERVELWTCPALKAWSNINETEGDFRARLTHQAREARDAQVAELRDSLTKKLAAVEKRRITAEGQLARQKSEATAAKMQAGASVLGGVLGAIFGRKAGIGSARGSSAISKASQVYKQHQDVSTATAKVDAIDEEMQSLQQATENEINQLAAQYDISALVLEKESFKPARTNIQVNQVALLWMPTNA